MKDRVPLPGNDAFPYRGTMHSLIGERCIPLSGNDAFPYRGTVHSLIRERALPGERMQKSPAGIYSIPIIIMNNDEYKRRNIIPHPREHRSPL